MKCLRDPIWDMNMQGPCSSGRCNWPKCVPVERQQTNAYGVPVGTVRLKKVP